MVWRSLTIFAAVAASSAAGAASFDCAKRLNAAEHAVCAHRGLNDRDVRVAELYAIDRRLLPMGGRDALIESQRRWNHDRDHCGSATECLTRVYDRRITELRRIIEQRVVPRGPF